MVVPSLRQHQQPDCFHHESHQHQSRRRRREVPPPQVHQVVSEMHQALGTKQRLAVLRHMHDLIAGDASLAHLLVEAGSWNALVLQLRFSLHRHGTSLQEIEEICHVLSFLLCSCPPETQRSILFDDDTMDLLIRSCQWSGTARYSVLSVWYVASVSERGVYMILHSHRTLLSIGDFFRQSVQQRTEPLGNALGILKNATYYANDAWDHLSRVPGLLASLLEVSSCLGHGPKDSERLSAIWRNLAVIQENRSRLAQNPGVLNALHAMATHPSQDCQRFSTLRNVLNTILSLSMDVESCLILLMHGDGIFSALMQGLFECSDEMVRKRAARTVRLWASHEQSGALLVHCHPLMDRVSAVAIRDSCQDVRQEAAEAFGRCAGWVQAPMPQQVAVLDALASLCRSSGPNVVARALKGQAAHASNRLLLIERPIFLETLISIALESSNSSVAKEDACCALADLASEKSNRHRMATTSLFEALCANMAAPNRREHAVRALVHLAHEKTNTPKMLHFPMLLQSLIQYAATAENSIKGYVKHAILLLVTEI